MTDAAKIGVLAMVLWAAGTGLAFRGSMLYGFIVLLIAFILGCLAAWKGSKWWLILPLVLLAELFRGLYMAVPSIF